MSSPAPVGVEWNLTVQPSSIEPSNTEVFDETTFFNAALIDCYIEYMEAYPEECLSCYVGKLVENRGVFVHPRSVTKLETYVEKINFKGFSRVLDKCLDHFHGGPANLFLVPMGGILLKGIRCLSDGDQIVLLKNVCTNTKFRDAQYTYSHDYCAKLAYIMDHEPAGDVDKKEQMSMLLWLFIQDPKNLIQVLLSHYVTGMHSLPPVQFNKTNTTCIQLVLSTVHENVPKKYIYGRYLAVFNEALVYDSSHEIQLDMIEHFIERSLLCPKMFLKHVLAPSLLPSTKFRFIAYLLKTTRRFIELCHLLPTGDHWVNLLSVLAVLLCETRWNFHNFCEQRTRLCDQITDIIRYHHSLCVASGNVSGFNFKNVPSEMKTILENCHLLNRVHFLHLFRARKSEFTIDKMQDLVITSICKGNLVTYERLIEPSCPDVQIRSECMFFVSIARVMPLFTVYEMTSFLTNFFGSNTSIETIIDAWAFFLSAMMDAYLLVLKEWETYGKYPSYDDELWNFMNYIVDVFFSFIENKPRLQFVYEWNGNFELKMKTIAKISGMIKSVVGEDKLPLFALLRRFIRPIMDHLNAEQTEQVLQCIEHLAHGLYIKCLGNIPQLLATRIELE